MKENKINIKKRKRKINIKINRKNTVNLNQGQNREVDRKKNRKNRLIHINKKVLVLKEVNWHKNKNWENLKWDKLKLEF